MDVLARAISIFTFVVMWDRMRRLLEDSRAGFLSAAVLWAGWAVTISEGLGLFRGLT